MAVAICLKGFNIEYGNNLSTKQLTKNGYPVFGANGQIGFYKKYTYAEPQALMSCRGAYSGKMNRSLPFSYITSNSLIIQDISKQMTVDYICYLFSAMDTSQLITGSAQPQITIQSFNKFLIPIPPFDEQQHIVDIIDSLFAKLDKAKTLAQNIIDNYESRRSSILHKALTGYLTNSNFENWRKTILSDVCKSIYDGDHMPPPKVENGIPFLVISNLSNGQLSFENSRFVSKNYYSNLTYTRKPEFDDILYTLVGSYGIPILINTNKSFCFQRHIGILKPNKEKIISKFLWYNLQSDYMYQQAKNIATGTAQLTVPIKKFRNLNFNLPTIKEQK